jgi:Protein of unknown function (DUF2797)
MTVATPASGQPIQLTGYTWSTGALQVRWRPWPVPAPAAPAETLRWPIAPGAFLDVTPTPPGVAAERRCIGYHPPEGGPPRLCPDWSALPPGRDSQCDLCETLEARREIVVSDGSRPPTGPHAAYLLSSHEVYLAAFAHDVYKVGVAGGGRARIRVLEQGAPAGLVIARATDGMAARRLEHSVGQLGVRERVAVRTKLKLLYPPPNAAALLGELRAALDRLAERLPGGWPDEVERVDPPDPLDNTPALHLDALDVQPQPARPPPQGTLRGQVVAASGSLLVMREPQVSLWGESAAPLEAYDLRLWLGWRLIPL